MKIKQTAPGDVIKHYIIEGLGLSVPELARAINVPSNRLYQIIQNKRDISVDTAIRLGLFLDMPPNFWLDIQSQHQIKAMKDNRPGLTNEIIPFSKLSQQKASFQ